MQKHLNGLFSSVKSSPKVAYKRKIPGLLFSFLCPKEDSNADWKERMVFL